MNKIKSNFINSNKLKIFDIDAYQLRGKKFFKDIFDYRKKIYSSQKHRIKKLKDFECNLCKKKKGDIFLIWKDKYQLISCRNCRAISANIDLINEKKFIDSVYNDKIYAKKVFDAIYKNYNYRKNTFGKERFEYTVKRLKLKKSSRVLDLGCGFGYYINYLKTKKIFAKGIEPSTDTTKFCVDQLKLNVVSSTLETEKNKEYDLITLFDVIEHLKNPVDYFNQINKKLKKGGYCVAYTPNIHSFSYTIMGSNQNTMLPFEHLCFFNLDSFKYLAKKTNFEIYSCETFGLDILDYFLYKEYTDKIKYNLKLKELTKYLQPILDKFGLSNHFRVTFKKKI